MRKIMMVAMMLAASSPVIVRADDLPEGYVIDTRLHRNLIGFFNVKSAELTNVEMPDSAGDDRFNASLIIDVHMEGNICCGATPEQIVYEDIQTNAGDSAEKHVITIMATSMASSDRPCFAYSQPVNAKVKIGISKSMGNAEKKVLTYSFNYGKDSVAKKVVVTITRNKYSVIVK